MWREWPWRQGNFSSKSSARYLCTFGLAKYKVCECMAQPRINVTFRTNSRAYVLITNVQLCSGLLNVITYRQNTFLIHSGAIITYLPFCQRSLLFGVAVAFVGPAVLNIYFVFFINLFSISLSLASESCWRSTPEV